MTYEFELGKVEPGETKHFKCEVSETPLGDGIKIPATIINGEKDGPIVTLSAAVHGDELNGTKIVQTVANDWREKISAGTVICLPIVNPYGLITRDRYIPTHDRDINRSFKKPKNGKSSNRIAHFVFENFLKKSDYGIDIHSSTRGRKNTVFVRGDKNDEGVSELIESFGSQVVISKEGPKNSLRREATKDGTPVITIEAGEAQRFNNDLIDEVLNGIQSVFADFEMISGDYNREPDWQVEIEGWSDRTWIRADEGGIVDVPHSPGDFVSEGDILYTLSKPIANEKREIKAPNDGILIGVLQDPVAIPGNPICHFVEDNSDLFENRPNLDESDKIPQT